MMTSEWVGMLIDEGRQTADWSELLAWLDEEASYASWGGDVRGYDPLGEDLMATLLDLIGHGEHYPPAKVQSEVLRFCETEWQRISDPGKLRLFETIKEGFAGMADPFCKFLSVELLGEFFADRNALGALATLSKSKQDVTRQYAVVGLAELARHTSETQIRSQAVMLLQGLCKDSSGKVREEAASLLYAIERR